MKPEELSNIIRRFESETCANVASITLNEVEYDELLASSHPAQIEAPTKSYPRTVVFRGTKVVCDPNLLRRYLAACVLRDERGMGNGKEEVHSQDCEIFRDAFHSTIRKMNELDTFLDVLERASGNTPNRSVNRLERIRVLWRDGSKFQKSHMTPIAAQGLTKLYNLLHEAYDTIEQMRPAGGFMPPGNSARGTVSFTQGKLPCGHDILADCRCHEAKPEPEKPAFLRKIMD